MELIVEDDGVGTAREVANAQQPPTLGLSLVRSLAKQLDAELDVESQSGTRYRLRFDMSTDQGAAR